MRFGIAGLTVSIFSLFSASAQDGILADWEMEFRADVSLVASPGREDAGEVDSEPVLGDTRAELRFEKVLESGAEIGARIGGRAQFDHPARQGFSGRIGDGTVAAGTAGLLPRGAFTGLTVGGPLEDDGFEIELETAFVYIDGGYGELLAGRDVGIARRFHEGAPSVFRLHRGVNASLDTSGVATVLTRNDLTGPSAKVSYASPRILGVRLGGSYTPDVNVGGVDRDPERSVPGVAEPRLSQAFEMAFNASRRLGDAGVRVDVYGAFGRADVDTLPGDIDLGTLQVWSTGGNLEWERLRFGADWLTTDNGGGRYRAWSIGLGADWRGFAWSGGFGRSRDDLTGIDGETWHIGLSRDLWERWSVAVGIDQNRIIVANESSDSSLGPVIEITLQL
ncbi:MAG: porin [Pseudomonadota bacterium]